MSDKQLILDTLERYAEAYCKKRTDQLMELFVDSDEISLIGTGEDELCVGAAEIRGVFERNFAEATATKFEWLWQQITIIGSSAIVAVTLKIHLTIDDQNLQIPIRWTVGLAKIDGNWRWLHRHASAAANSQDKGSAYPMD